MHVHVPQTRDEELATGIDGTRTFRRASPGAHFDNAAASEHHIHLPSRPSIGTIDDCDVAEDDRPLVCGGVCHESREQ